MDKEFIEHYSENEKIPYSASTLCFFLTQYARDYIRVERKMMSAIDKDIRDAVLVDAINYIARTINYKFELYSSDLYTELNVFENVEQANEVDTQYLLTAVSNYSATYIFQEGIAESVEKNGHTNDYLGGIINENEGVKVLVDFINYLAQVNDYDRIFTIEDLDRINYQNEMSRLKEFLMETARYDTLQRGTSINCIFKEITRWFGIKYVSRREICHSTFEKNSSECALIPLPSKKEFLKELYVMAYAYAKLVPEGEKEVPLAIRRKIKEMSQK